MKKKILWLLAFAGLLGASLLLLRRGPRLEDYQALLEPRLSELAAQRMLVVEAKGDPKSTSQAAFGRLFKAYYGLKGVRKNSLRPPAPRARWTLPSGVDAARWDKIPPSEWTGHFGLPLPEDAAVQLDAGPGTPAAKLETWAQGTVAEILHVGPYDAERPAIDKLHRFIQDQGYVISGPHEEEYVKGPGMFFAGNPKKYLTIIRYEVRKVKK